MTAQRCQFKVECSGNIGKIVDIFRSPEQHFLDFMGLQILFEQFRVSQMIPGIRKNRIDGDLAGNAMALPDLAITMLCSLCSLETDIWTGDTKFLDGRAPAGPGVFSFSITNQDGNMDDALDQALGADGLADSEIDPPDHAAQHGGDDLESD